MARTLGDFIAEARRRIQEIDAEILEDWIRSRDDLLLVDVREADEFQDGHIPDAILIPRGMLEAAADPGTRHRHPLLCDARCRPVVVYCASGGRSALAASTLQEMGFEEVYSLAGGLDVWEAEGFPLAD